ncbi:MAG: hypothetical protein UU73_C0003G0012 [Candidatus Daviesbacteria bacterium GW2011_GWA1_41_61]|uniref:Uncharacterized protein n=1 Tax=Candidatus Daviesbacteria bacterium GW2011_GWA2_40_9 TaxID=1618424 RepID=A0A0G0X3J7_9BACT|nr:MAG: hypothetical protein UU26_C0005G0043 [Candidatus Daviesbacteria bacterium GW2011_GWC1_40_9]KKR82172.1 MAG: hypothetical protein UU29_C0017G0008 [Candidatus Daviesbacteria bacterium GW2011_GWA2_40_9]KKR93636.1 MAG: hypothetical protein UU44_C0002G0297 [Candidatus Daviesbacteria bacterium GW2011_GWB1_41_15]KKS14813.1 MAG: hypothetical protein UU73_C0003G0012 [Candidatus Daviesbacteria bacterium GW2011_GWA1_41_61]
MKRRKIKTSYPKSRNAFILVALVITATIITALFSTFFIHVYAKEKITISEFQISTNVAIP